MDRAKLKFIFVALLCSLLVHSPLVLLFFAHDVSEKKEEATKELQLELVTQEDAADQETVQEDSHPASGAQSATSAADPAPDSGPKAEISARDSLKKNKLEDPVDDFRVQKALKQIKKKIITVWQQATPPAIGRVSLEMEVSASGTVEINWITNLKGPSELGDFVLELLNQIDFSDLSGLKRLGRPVIIECSFDVTGTSGDEGS